MRKNKIANLFSRCRTNWTEPRFDDCAFSFVDLLMELPYPVSALKKNLQTPSLKTKNVLDQADNSADGDDLAFVMLTTMNGCNRSLTLGGKHVVRTGFAVSSRNILLLLLLLVIWPTSGCTMLELYPPGPATQNFKTSCLSPQTAPVACDELASIGNTTASADINTERGLYTVDKEMRSAIQCTTTTRDNFGQFLECGEEEQLLAGFGIVSTAAAASSLATAGVSGVAAVALGSASTGGLGLEFALYNKPKRKAYSDATIQLQCVAGESAPLEHSLTNLKAIDWATAIDPARLACLQASGWDDASLVVAQYNIAKQRESFAERRLQGLPVDIVATVQNIDVRAFTGAQSGVPDADQIQKGVNIVSGTSSKAKAPAAAAAPALAPEAAPPPPPSCVYSDLEKVKDTTDQLNLELALMQLPASGFPDCLAIKAIDETASNSSDNSSKGNQNGNSKNKNAKNNNSKNGSASSNGDTSASSNGSPAQPSAAPSPGSDSPPEQPLTKVAFQVQPSDHVSVESKKTTPIKVVGGTPPYYAVVVDDNVEVTKATQTDLFVSFEVGLNNEQTGRLLVGDQAGAEELVYVNFAKSTSKPAPTHPAPHRPGRTHQG